MIYVYVYVPIGSILHEFPLKLSIVFHFVDLNNVWILLKTKKNTHILCIDKMSVEFLDNVIYCQTLFFTLETFLHRENIFYNIYMYIKKFTTTYIQSPMYSVDSKWTFLYSKLLRVL